MKEININKTNDGLFVIMKYSKTDDKKIVSYSFFNDGVQFNIASTLNLSFEQEFTFIAQADEIIKNVLIEKCKLLNIKTTDKMNKMCLECGEVGTQYYFYEFV